MSGMQDIPEQCLKLKRPGSHPPSWCNPSTTPSTSHRRGYYSVAPGWPSFGAMCFPRYHRAWLNMGGDKPFLPVSLSACLRGAKSSTRSSDQGDGHLWLSSGSDVTPPFPTDIPYPSWLVHVLLSAARGWNLIFTEWGADEKGSWRC